MHRLNICESPGTSSNGNTSSECAGRVIRVPAVASTGAGGGGWDGGGVQERGQGVGGRELPTEAKGGQPPEKGGKPPRT